MSELEDNYQQLRRLDDDARPMWLRTHKPKEASGWWLGLVERAEFDASPSRNNSVERLKEDLEFFVNLLDLAVADGMPSYYAVSRLARLASGLIRLGRPIPGVPSALIPDNLARRAMATFRLSREEARAVAAGQRKVDQPNAGYDALKEINWLLPDLAMLADHLNDATLTHEVRLWVDIADELSPV